MNTNLLSFLTETTCGEACWEAREDVCRCSCGGRNHGCLRSADGIRPTRNAKIDGFRYELKAVGGREMYGEAAAVNVAAGPKQILGSCHYRWEPTDKGAPARVKPATKDQLGRWPELADARAKIATIVAERHCQIDIDRVWPYLLWVKAEAVNHGN